MLHTAICVCASIVVFYSSHSQIGVLYSYICYQHTNTYIQRYKYMAIAIARSKRHLHSITYEHNIYNSIKSSYRCRFRASRLRLAYRHMRMPRRHIMKIFAATITSTTHWSTVGIASRPSSSRPLTRARRSWECARRCCMHEIREQNNKRQGCSTQLPCGVVFCRCIQIYI